MKIKRYLAMAACALPVFTSCLDDADDYNGYYYYPNEIVTVKPNADNSDFFIQVHGETAKVINYVRSPFGKKEVRAIAHITENETASHEGYDMAVRINWIDSLLTKDPIVMTSSLTPGGGPDNGKAAEGGDETVDYGSDPIDILVSPYTLLEDGYLTLHFRTRSGYNTKHWLNLIVNPDRNDPYLVEFCQKTEGETFGDLREGFVAFRLKGALPDTNGKTKKLKVRWTDLAGNTKTRELFEYCTPEAQ